MTYRITNQVLGTTIFVNALPADVRLGHTDIGPSWNNRPAPKLIVEAVRSCYPAGCPDPDWCAGNHECHWDCAGLTEDDAP
jgi:hypothetical protein